MGRMNMLCWEDGDSVGRMHMMCGESVEDGDRVWEG